MKQDGRCSIHPSIQLCAFLPDGQVKVLLQECPLCALIRPASKGSGCGYVRNDNEGNSNGGGDFISETEAHGRKGFTLAELSLRDHRHSSRRSPSRTRNSSRSRRSKSKCRHRSQSRTASRSEGGSKSHRDDNYERRRRRSKSRSGRIEHEDGSSTSHRSKSRHRSHRSKSRVRDRSKSRVRERSKSRPRERSKSRPRDWSKSRTRDRSTSRTRSHRSKSRRSHRSKSRISHRSNRPLQDMQSTQASVSNNSTMTGCIIEVRQYSLNGEDDSDPSSQVHQNGNISFLSTPDEDLLGGSESCLSFGNTVHSKMSSSVTSGRKHRTTRNKLRNSVTTATTAGSLSHCQRSATTLSTYSLTVENDSREDETNNNDSESVASSSSWNHFNNGISYCQSHEYSKARTIFLKVMKARSETFGPNHEYLAPVYEMLGHVERGLENHEVALSYYIKALKILDLKIKSSKQNQNGAHDQRQTHQLNLKSNSTTALNDIQNLELYEEGDLDVGHLQSTDEAYLLTDSEIELIATRIRMSLIENSRELEAKKRERSDSENANGVLLGENNTTSNDSHTGKSEASKDLSSCGTATKPFRPPPPPPPPKVAKPPGILRSSIKSRQSVQPTITEESTRCSQPLCVTPLDG